MVPKGVKTEHQTILNIPGKENHLSEHTDPSSTAGSDHLQQNYQEIANTHREKSKPA